MRVGTVEPMSPNHDEVRWATMGELANMPADQLVGHFRDEAIVLVKQWLARGPCRADLVERGSSPP